MRLKLDENFGRRIREIFEDAGFDVETALSERLSGAADDALFEVCCRERRCLVTLDLDFADPVRFRPESCPGIVVIRLPHDASARLIESLARETVGALQRMRLAGDLWIVEPGRIRVHQKEDEPS